jgi:hypothetical protein
MVADRRRRILERLNTLDTGPTEKDRSAERQAAIESAIETEQALKWGRIQSGTLWGMFGWSASSHYKRAG